MFCADVFITERLRFVLGLFQHFSERVAQNRLGADLKRRRSLQHAIELGDGRTGLNLTAEQYLRHDAFRLRDERVHELVDVEL